MYNYDRFSALPPVFPRENILLNPENKAQGMIQYIRSVVIDILYVMDADTPKLQSS